MDEGRLELKAVRKAIDDFELAVKRHEHTRLFDNEVVLRQEVDRAREVLMSRVIEMAKATRSGAS